MSLRSIVVLAACAAFFAIAGNATAATFTPSDDAFATTADPGTAYGTGQWVRVGSGSATRVTYVKFTVSGLTGSIAKATLRLYNVTGGSGLSTHPVSSNAWSEATLTWNNQPGYSSAITSQATSFPTNTWVAVDVTPLITGNGTFTIAVTSQSTTPIDFDAKENGAANAPQLVITTAAGPGNTALPTISGTAQQGQTLTAS